MADNPSINIKVNLEKYRIETPSIMESIQHNMLMAYTQSIEQSFLKMAKQIHKSNTTGLIPQSVESYIHELAFNDKSLQAYSLGGLDSPLPIMGHNAQKIILQWRLPSDSKERALLGIKHPRPVVFTISDSVHYNTSTDLNFYLSPQSSNGVLMWTTPVLPLPQYLLRLATVGEWASSFAWDVSHGGEVQSVDLFVNSLCPLEVICGLMATIRGRFASAAVEELIKRHGENTPLYHHLFTAFHLSALNGIGEQMAEQIDLRKLGMFLSLIPNIRIDPHHLQDGVAEIRIPVAPSISPNMFGSVSMPQIEHIRIPLCKLDFIVDTRDWDIGGFIKLIYRSLVGTTTTMFERRFTRAQFAGLFKSISSPAPVNSIEQIIHRKRGFRKVKK